MNSPERSDAGSPGCGVNRRAGGFSRKLNATSHTGWARFAVWRSTLELSDSIRDQACQLFRSAQNEDLLRGRSIEAIATASVYGACRCNDRPVILDEVADSARVELSRVRNAYKTLNTELGLSLPHREGRSRSFRASRQNWTSLTRSDSGRLNSQRALKRRLSRTDANRQVSQRPASIRLLGSRDNFHANRSRRGGGDNAGNDTHTMERTRGGRRFEVSPRVAGGSETLVNRRRLSPNTDRSG